MKFVIFDAQGFEVRRGECPPADLERQAGEGEIAVEHEWESHYTTSLFRCEDGTLEERDRPQAAAEVERLAWKAAKRSLAATLAAGYPSQYGPVDLRPGARQVMLTAVTLGQGLDLILLDNSVVSLTGEQVAELLTNSLAWEQARVMETQAERPV